VEWQAEQRKLVERALVDASDAVKRHALDGTIGDTQAFCWGALRQFERLNAQYEQVAWDARAFGLAHADLHSLLILAAETVSHVERVEDLLRSIGEPQHLPPRPELRDPLREARNLLAEHRDERVLYWRLTRRHTPHVGQVYERLDVSLPLGPDEVIDTQTLFPGIVGGLLELPDLRDSLEELEHELDALAATYRGQGQPPPSRVTDRGPSD
jgi:hypothetical protein